jgi:hypothetical protein
LQRCETPFVFFRALSRRIHGISGSRLRPRLEGGPIALKWVFWGRPGFDVGTDPAQGMPSTSSLVNPLETK